MSVYLEDGVRATGSAIDPEPAGNGDGVQNEFLQDSTPTDNRAETLMSAVGGGMVLLDTLIVWLVLGYALQVSLSIVIGNESWAGIGYVLAGVLLIGWELGFSDRRRVTDAGGKP